MANHFEKAAKQIDWNDAYGHVNAQGMGEAMARAFDDLADANLYPPDLELGSQALFSTLGLDATLRSGRYLDLDQVCQPANYRQLGAAITAWRTALPFAEGELVRIVPMHRALVQMESVKTWDYWLPVLRLMPDFAFMDRGRRQTAAGPELADRWEDWHKQRGAYAGQGSLMAARTAIVGMAAVVPLDGWRGLAHIRTEPGHATDPMHR